MKCWARRHRTPDAGRQRQATNGAATPATPAASRPPRNEKTRARSSVLTLVVGLAVRGQEAPAPEEPKPAPRWADGRISFSGGPQDVGNWEGPANGAELIYPTPEDDPANGTDALPTNLPVERVPFQPWARALFDYRQRTYLKDEPHVRCKPSGVARLFHTPYGLEILNPPDSGEVIFVGVGSPHSWRVIDLQATEHAPDGEATRYGHSIGHWEGDTLVIDTIGFADSFWMNRLGLPHTDRLHTIERISRPTSTR